MSWFSSSRSLGSEVFFSAAKPGQWRNVYQNSPMAPTPYLLTINVVRAIESQPTGSGDVPESLCTIVACGELDLSDPSLLQSAASADGDPYEDYPQDQDALSDGDIQEKPEVALRVAREIREIGNKLFKEGRTEEALNKYQSVYIQLSSYTRLCRCLTRLPRRGGPLSRCPSRPPGRRASRAR